MHNPEAVSVIAEQIIQAADVSHTMQHFSTFAKWNTHLYHEVLAAYNCGRMYQDKREEGGGTAAASAKNTPLPGLSHPKENWYESQIGFFDHYVIPLAERLDACGVFFGEQTFAQLAARNKEQWIEVGRECTALMVAEAERMELPPPIPPIYDHSEKMETMAESGWKLNKIVVDSSVSTTEDTDVMSSQTSVETSSRVSYTEGVSHSSRSWRSRSTTKWRRSSTSSFSCDVDSSINAFVPHICVKQLIDSFQSNISSQPPNLRKYALRSALTEYQSAGFIQRQRGVLLFVDISGFTELSQRFNIEDFKNFINTYFSKIIELVECFGGEVVKFAGDALFAVWSTPRVVVPHDCDAGVGHSDDVQFGDSSHALNIEKCVSCATAIIIECNNYKVSKKYNTTREEASSDKPNTKVDDHHFDERMATLTVYCGISEGIMAGVNVVANNRAEFFLVGKPLKGKEIELDLEHPIRHPYTVSYISFIICEQMRRELNTWQDLGN